MSHRFRPLHFRRIHTMTLQCLIASMISILTVVLGAGVAHAQGYPNKVIRIFTTEPGSNSDIASRLIAQGISPSLGQPVVIENRAGGIVAVETSAKSAPDGHTLLHYGSTVWLLPYMRDNVPWDALRDFAPISLTLSSPNLLVVHPALPVSSVKDLVALIKTKPDEYNYSLGSRGTSPHLAVELFKALTGINVVAVPYKGNVPALNALLAGEVHMVFSTAATGGPFVKSGKLRALAVTSGEPSALFPGVPTVAASGLSGYESVSITGMFAPAKTPDAVIRRLNQEIVRFLNQADTKEKFLNAGSDVVGTAPEEFLAKMKSEMSRMGKVIKDAGIRAD